jgi:hypothetical protein
LNIIDGMKGQMLPFAGADLLRRQEIAASAGAAFAVILASLRGTGPPTPEPAECIPAQKKVVF